MSGLGEIRRARAEAKHARVRLGEDVATLRDRLSPATAVANMRARAEDTVAELRDRAVTTARRRPMVIVAGVAALGLVAAFGPVRRTATALCHGLWRNRAAIGLFIHKKRLAKKDSTR